VRANGLGPRDEAFRRARFSLRNAPGIDHKRERDRAFMERGADAHTWGAACAAERRTACRDPGQRWRPGRGACRQSMPGYARGAARPSASTGTSPTSSTGSSNNTSSLQLLASSSGSSVWACRSASATHRRASPRNLNGTPDGTSPKTVFTFFSKAVPIGSRDTWSKALGEIGIRRPQRGCKGDGFLGYPDQFVELLIARRAARDDVRQRDVHDARCGDARKQILQAQLLCPPKPWPGGLSDGDRRHVGNRVLVAIPFVDPCQQQPHHERGQHLGRAFVRMPQAEQES